MPTRPDDEIEHLSPRHDIRKGVFVRVFKLRSPAPPKDIAKTHEALGDRPNVARMRVAAGEVEDAGDDYFAVGGVRFYWRDVTAGVYVVEVAKPRRS